MYVYIKNLKNFYEVGFYNPKGAFLTESVWPSRLFAVRRVNFLNGGNIENYFIPPWDCPICAKSFTAFEETSDAQCFIELTGVCEEHGRFNLNEEDFWVQESVRGDE